MWNPISRLTGAAPPAGGVARDGVVRGVGAERGGNYDRRHDHYLRRRVAELCVVGVVVGAALYLFMPSFMGTAESARRATCVSHLRRLAQAIEMYQSDNDGYPPTVGWVPALYPLFTDRDGIDALFCPSETSLPRPLHKSRIYDASSYSYRNPSDRGPGHDEAGSAVVWDYLGGCGGGAHPGGGNVAYLDGHVVWRPHETWQNSDLP
jgi:prepilin-type processing-associated H-X9-DG protein